MVRFRFVSFAFLVLPLLAADRFDAVRQSIRKQLVETTVPSIAVAVAQDGKILWEEGFGWANREKRVAATEHTTYSLASISKPITATALMTLVQAGRIDLDKPVNDYLGDAKVQGRAGEAREATVRRVANHSSGLPLHYQFFYADEPYHRPPMDVTILRYANLVHPPGEKHVYSNLGYGVLDYVISRVSGRPFADYLRDAVFMKLGMTHSSLHLTPQLEEFQAVRYTPDGRPIPYYDFDHPGGSAAYASAHDLVRFGLFHLRAHLADQKAVLTDASIDSMQKPTIMVDDKTGYGIAWRIADHGNGIRVVSHNGSMGGVATTLRLVPSRKLAVVVLANGSSMLPHKIADEIFDVMAPGWRSNASTNNSAAVSGKFDPPAELRGRWTGILHTWRRDIPLSIEMLPSGDVHAQLGDQLRALVNEPKFENGEFTGRMVGDVDTEDVNRRPYTLSLSLVLRSGKLTGSAAALSLPGKWPGNALSHWVELRR